MLRTLRLRTWQRDLFDEDVPGDPPYDNLTGSADDNGGAAEYLVDALESEVSASMISGWSGQRITYVGMRVGPLAQASTLRRRP